VVEGTWQFIARTAVPHSQAEYEHLLGLRDKLFNANGAIYVGVLIWWIACLWMDEPGAATGEPQLATPQPKYLVAESEEPAGAEPEEDAGIGE